ncbi:hypothetical protein [Caballeronia zhejiangensis]|uniref:hypothetical protein n=1 Tax=Caballeronia zhejiangensis TaxID=871203 RepID=UPI001EF4EC98|nr:hypothetical protein [Caballeronia zhejiangensis]MCG7400309.1 hypothetical protein [Caballeronia zhejiangensis]
MVLIPGATKFEHLTDNSLAPTFRRTRCARSDAAFDGIYQARIDVERTGRSNRPPLPARIAELSMETIATATSKFLRVFPKNKKRLKLVPNKNRAEIGPRRVFVSRGSTQ